MFDKFVSELSCEDTNGLDWLDSWARTFPVVSSKTLRYSVASALPIACDILGNAPSCPIACDNVFAMPKCGPMPKWFKTELGTIRQECNNMHIEGLNPAVELRYNLFGKMLANFHENDGKFLQAEEFDKCFKGD